MSERGEAVLRRREEDGALELRVNGVFVMDTVETSSERVLARATLSTVSPDRSMLTVLVGGLGLGYTLTEVLADPRVAYVTVAEIEPDLVAWHRRGLVPPTSPALEDPRTEIVVGDVRRVIATQPAGSLDLVLLDVDNGPAYLVYDANAAVYELPFLQACGDTLASEGVLAVWSAAEAPQLAAAIEQVFGHVDQLVAPVTLGRRETTYHVLVGRR
ncbi:MAG: spermidine synthase [Nocardioidaceae bacterium]